jgi:hypothetical protein
VPTKRLEGDIFAEDGVGCFGVMAIFRTTKHEIEGQEDSAKSHLVVDILRSEEMVLEPVKDVKGDGQTLS